MGAARDQLGAFGHLGRRQRGRNRSADDLSIFVAGISDGSAGQQFELNQTQIDPTTFQLEVDMPGLGFQLWQAVDDLAVQQGPVPVYVLDPEAGTVASAIRCAA